MFDRIEEFCKIIALVSAVVMVASFAAICAYGAFWFITHLP